MKLVKTMMSVEMNNLRGKSVRKRMILREDKLKEKKKLLR